MFGACTKILNHLTEGGLNPQLHLLDNEAYNAPKKKILKNDIAYQLVPPGTHLHNSEEQSIQIYKNHFITELFRLNTNLPVHVLDRLVPHAEILLKLLRQSQLHQKLSADAYLNVQ